MNKITVEDQSSVKKTIHVEIPRETVEQALDTAFSELRKNASVKGFRQGKAPRSVLERIYGKDVRLDVTSRLIQDSFKDAVVETGLMIIAPPRIDPPEIKPGEAFAYKADVEIQPTIEDIDFKGLSLKKNLYRVSDQEIETHLKLLQKRLTRHQPITEDRPVETRDIVVVDYEGFEGDAPSEAAGRTENFSMKIGEAAISKTLDEAMVGMTKGEERKIEVTFPEDHANPALSGKTILFSVKLNDIRQEVVPEINDDMAKEIGSYETLSALKAAINENLQSGYDKRSEQEINEQIFSSIIASTQFEVPDTLVEMEMDAIIQEAEQAFMYRNMTFEQAGITIEGLKGKYRETAEKQVRRQLILGKIIEQEKIDITEDAFDETFREMAETYQRPVEDVASFYAENPDKKQALKHALLEKKAIKVIIENGHIEEIPAETSQAEGQ